MRYSYACLRPQSFNGKKFPCGSCDTCRVNRSRDLEFRTILEADAHPTVHAATLTLEAGSEQLPYAAVQTYIDGIRKRVSRAKLGTIRFLCVLEHGEKNSRRHWHILVMGQKGLLLRHTIGRDNAQKKQYWPHGHTHSKVSKSDAKQGSADLVQYVCKYATKNVDGLPVAPDQRRERSIVKSKSWGIHALTVLADQDRAVIFGSNSNVEALAIDGEIRQIPFFVRTRFAKEIAKAGLPVQAVQVPLTDEEQDVQAVASAPIPGSPDFIGPLEQFQVGPWLEPSKLVQPWHRRGDGFTRDQLEPARHRLERQNSNVTAFRRYQASLLDKETPHRNGKGHPVAYTTSLVQFTHPFALIAGICPITGEIDAYPGTLSWKKFVWSELAKLGDEQPSRRNQSLFSRASQYRFAVEEYRKDRGNLQPAQETISWTKPDQPAIARSHEVLRIVVPTDENTRHSAESWLVNYYADGRIIGYDLLNFGSKGSADAFGAMYDRGKYSPTDQAPARLEEGEQPESLPDNEHAASPAEEQAAVPAPREYPWIVRRPDGKVRIDWEIFDQHDHPSGRSTRQALHLSVSDLHTSRYPPRPIHPSHNETDVPLDPMHPPRLIGKVWHSNPRLTAKAKPFFARNETANASPKFETPKSGSEQPKLTATAVSQVRKAVHGSNPQRATRKAPARKHDQTRTPVRKSKKPPS